MPRSATTSIDSRPVDYWSLAHQPLACLVFLTPLLFIYEAGVIVLGDGQPAAVRNGADYWMRVCLGWAGVTWMPILPAIVLGFLLIRHLNCRHPWTVDGLTLAGMAAESVLFAFVLLAIGRGHEFVFRDALPDSSLTAVMPSAQTANRIIAFIGAGVYEEVLFRLCMLPAVFGFLRLLGASSVVATLTAIVTTSLLFAGAHYIGPAADRFTLFSFTFRTTAGIFFACLFCARGFGIAVGTHAAYDLLVGVLLATPAAA